MKAMESKHRSGMLALSGMFAFLLFGISAHGDDSTFVRVTQIDGLRGIDTAQAGDMISFQVTFGNRSSVRYNLSNGFKIYSRASIDSGDPGSGTATWQSVQPAAGTAFAYRFPDGPGGNTGPLLDTTGYLKKSDFGALFRFNCFSCDGQGADTIGFGAAASEPGGGMYAKDSGVAFIIKVATKLQDTNKVICLDSTTNYPSTNTWKWASTREIPGSLVVFPDWSGPICIFLYGGPPCACCGCDDVTESEAPPARFDLMQNHPNPFNPSTTIEFSLIKRIRVKIEIFNLLGREVRTLLDEPRSAGTHRVVWDGSDHLGQAVASGVYFYRLTADRCVISKKMTLLR